MHRKLLTAILLFVVYAWATKYAGDFQELGVGARPLGMGSAFVAGSADPFSLYWNPAGSARVEKKTISFMHAENFAGIVKNEYLSFILPHEGNTIGAAYYYLGVPGIMLTRLADTLREPSETNRPIPYDTVTASDHLVYLNYSRGRGRVSFGASLKLYYRDLTVTKGFGGGIDLGLITYLSTISLGLAIRDVILSPVIWDDGYREQILPKFTVGVAPEIPLTALKSALRIEWDLVRFIDNTSRFEQNLGAEFGYRNSAFLRFGLKNFRPTLGVGLRWKAFDLDYAFVSHSDLKSSNKLSAGVRF